MHTSRAYVHVMFTRLYFTTRKRYHDSYWLAFVSASVGSCL